MGQFVVHDQVASRYAEGVDQLWASWEPSASTTSELLASDELRDEIGTAAVSTALRRAQYRSHVGAELGAGLVPPPSALDAHAVLVGALSACRDTFSILAVRAELDELDDETAEFGAQALTLALEAFHGARSTTALVHAWVTDDQQLAWLETHTPRERSRIMSLVIWSLVGLCAVLLCALVVELVVLRS